MKRKATPKSLRAGQTLFFVAVPKAHRKRIWGVGSVLVGSDKLPMPEGDDWHTCPRHALAENLALMPRAFSYSRRTIERQVKVQNALEDRIRAHRHAREDAL